MQYAGARVMRTRHRAQRFYRFEFDIADSDGDGVTDDYDLCPQI